MLRSRSQRTACNKIARARPQQIQVAANVRGTVVPLLRPQVRDILTFSMTAAGTTASTRLRYTSERWYTAILEFAGHVVGGTAIFVIIGAAGWLLHVATRIFGSENALLFYGLQCAEIFVFFADTVLYLLFVARTFWRAARKLVATWNQ